MRLFALLSIMSVFPFATVEAGSRADELTASVNASLVLLQQTGPKFWDGSGCVSCHNNTLPDMTIAIAAKRGFAVDPKVAAASILQTQQFLDVRSEGLLEGIAPGGGQNTLGSILFTLAEAGVPATPTLHAGARYLKLLQTPDGAWPVLNHRPPMVASTIALTSMSLRGLQAYAPPSQRAAYAESVSRAVGWLERTQPLVNEDYAFKLLGLTWGGGSRAARRATARDLLAQQRPDGGWSQLPALASDAYATGQALVALHADGLSRDDPAFARGIRFLLQTQASDGSWHVVTRSQPTQAYFEAGYPYGVDQFISAAGASWATLALVLAAR